MFHNKKEKLPLLKFISEKYCEANLSDTLIIACQHLLGTTYNLFEELFSKGLKPENVFLLGKCYSTNNKVLKRFIDKSVNVSNLSNAFNSRISFDRQFHDYVKRFLRDVREKTDIKKFNKVIIIDDGGSLLVFANDYFKETNNFVGIEQTTSGYEKLKNIHLMFPVFNIARSEAKLEYESPMIAQLVVDKINSYINIKNITNPKILVIGQGYVGQAIFNLLSKNFKDNFVKKCDKLANKCDYAGNYKSKIGEFDLIIGATGQPALNKNDFGNLKQGVILVSTSSSDREFSAVYLRLLEPKNSDCHKDYNVNGINLLNSGFPINFDGAEHSLAPEKIQLTRALLLAGIYESLKIKKDKGIQKLNEKIQKQLVAKFKELIFFA